MSDSWPELVVGIDFGTTGTAVAYARPTENVVHQLRRWSEDPQYPERDKVPTMAAFEGNNLAAWGVGVKSLSPEEIPNYGSYKQFKPLFDSDDTTVAAEAERCTRVFLRELRLYLEQALPHEKQLEGFTWDNSRIKYVFSYPTTWDLDTQMRFSDLVREAGYLPLDNQDIMTSLDEAQASILHFLCGRHGSGESLPKPDELILVADIGGGTSDIGIFKVVSIEGREPDLYCEVKDEGKQTGSTMVDEQFRERLREKLKGSCQNDLCGSATPKETRETVVDKFVDTAVFHVEQDTSYINAKHTYGKRAVGGKLPPPEFPLQFPDIAAAILSAENHGKMTKERLIVLPINRKDYFEDAFRSQCDKIWDQCKEQMDKLAEGRKIKHVVLAGGFGSSPYVVGALSEKFKSHRCSKESRVVDVRDAQLAVSRGLVQNELRNIYGNPGWVYPATYSYGIQKGADKDGIKWFLSQGDEVKCPRSFKVTRHLDINPNKFDLQLVRTSKRPIWGVIKSEEKKAEWRNTIHPVFGVSVNNWLQTSLPPNLKPDLSMRSSKKATVTFKGKMSRDAIALTLDHAGVEHGHPLIVLQDWHDTPKTKTSKTKTSTQDPGTWKWGLGETIGVVGVAFGGIAAALAAAAFWNDMRKKDDTQPPKPSPTEQENTPGPSAVPNPTDDHAPQTEGLAGMGPEADAKAANEQRAS